MSVLPANELNFFITVNGLVLLCFPSETLEFPKLRSVPEHDIVCEMRQNL